MTLVSAAININLNYGDVQTKNALDEKVRNAIENSPLVAGITYYIFGLHNLEKLDAPYGTASVYIVFFLVWLILFVTFSDVLVSFGAFSNRAIGWIVGGAITIIAANLKLVQIIAIWMINITAVFGTLAVFAGIILAFVAFLGVNVGMGRFAVWAVERQNTIRAARGRSEIREGIRLQQQAGAEVMRSSNQNWWVPILVLIVIIIVLGILIAIFG